MSWNITCLVRKKLGFNRDRDKVHGFKGKRAYASDAKFSTAFIQPHFFNALNLACCQKFSLHHDSFLWSAGKCVVWWRCCRARGSEAPLMLPRAVLASKCTSLTFAVSMCKVVCAKTHSLAHRHCEHKHTTATSNANYNSLACYPLRLYHTIGSPSTLINS